MTRRLSLALGIGLAWPLALSAEEPPGAIATTWVHKPDGTRHCETSAGIRLDAMAKELARAGVSVRSQCKSHDGREGVAVCGEPTGSINVYEVAESDLRRALDLGFQRGPRGCPAS